MTNRFAPVVAGLASIHGVGADRTMTGRIGAIFGVRSLMAHQARTQTPQMEEQ